MHILRGSSTIRLNSKYFIEFIVSLNCFVINHQKGEIESAFGPLSGFLVLMICIIKELMCLSSYGQVKIQRNEKEQEKMINLLKGRCWA
jgi:hypothetical protein